MDLAKLNLDGLWTLRCCLYEDYQRLRDDWYLVEAERVDAEMWRRRSSLDA